MSNQIGKQQYDAGTAQTTKGLTDFNAPASYYRKLLSGDPTELLSAVSPQVDQISMQFDQIRRMISDQPRGGGKTSVLASLPVSEAQSVANLESNAKSGAAQGLANIAGTETQAGQNEIGVGLSGAGQAAQIASGGRQQDISSSWKTMFQNLIGNSVSGLSQGVGSGIMKLLFQPKPIGGV